MPYQAPIQRTDPTALLFVVDQSSSMGDRIGLLPVSKTPC